MPTDSALVSWVDILPLGGPHAADPDGEHWGVVVRSRGTPSWVPIAGTGPDGLWTKEDTGLGDRVRTLLRRRPGAGQTELRPLVEKLRIQRIEPLAKVLAAATDGLRPVQRLIVLPSRAVAGIPIEVLLAPDDIRIVSYAPSATVFRYLREQPRPDRHSGLLALGDPVYESPDASSEPRPLPDHGLLVNMIAPGSNAATHGLKPGDVVLAYNGQRLNRQDDLKVVAEGDKPIGIEVWRDGQSSHRELAPGKLGAVIDPRLAREAIAANRAVNKVLVAARGGGEDFEPLPGTQLTRSRRLLPGSSKPTTGRPESSSATGASEPELDRLASLRASWAGSNSHPPGDAWRDRRGEFPQRSAVILTQSGLPDPLEQVLHQKPVFDGRLMVREIQRGWELKSELVTLFACETALGRDAGGEGIQWDSHRLRS